MYFSDMFSRPPCKERTHLGTQRIIIFLPSGGLNAGLRCSSEKNVRQFSADKDTSEREESNNK